MIDFRTATARDAPAIAELHARSWRESYRGEFLDSYLDGDLVDERLLVWRERLADPPAGQYVELAFDDSTLVGFLCAYAGHDPEWGSLIDNLHVSSGAKGSGVGTALMRRAGAWLAVHAPERAVYLLVLEANVSARRFYERLGARNAGVSTMETHGGAIVRSCRYTWPSPDRLAGD